MQQKWYIKNNHSMETNVSRMCCNPRKALLATAAFLLGSSLYALQPNESYTSLHNHCNNPVSRIITGKKENVKVTLSVSKRTLNVKVKGNKAAAYQFFLFCANGKLEKQFILNNGQQTAVPGIASGIYMYEIMLNDQRVKSGTVTIQP
jgi:hypothetical protein